MTATILNEAAAEHLPFGVFVIDEIHSSSGYAKGLIEGPTVEDLLTRINVDQLYQDQADGSVWFSGDVSTLDYPPTYLSGFRVALKGQRGQPGATFPKPKDTDMVDLHCTDGPTDVQPRETQAERMGVVQAVTTKLLEGARQTAPPMIREESPPRLPEDSAERKEYPIVTGVLDYFPDAIAELARLAKFGNDKHNPGEPLHWARGKSDDHIDCIGRHLIDRGRKDGDFYHDVMIAWRALANLQLVMEQSKGLPPSRGSRD